jgi:hypothetical protein
MTTPQKTLQAAFYTNDTGKRPVRDWLLELPPEDRKAIGEDIATLEFCWPIGQPNAWLCEEDTKDA